MCAVRFAPAAGAAVSCEAQSRPARCPRRQRLRRYPGAPFPHRSPPPAPQPTPPPETRHRGLLSAAGRGPRGARREAKSGFQLEAASAPGCSVAWPGHFAAAGGGAVLRSEGSGDPSRRVAPARLQGRLQQLLCPCSAPAGPNRLKPAQAGSALFFPSVLPPPPLPALYWPPSQKHCKLCCPAASPQPGTASLHRSVPG